MKKPQMKIVRLRSESGTPVLPPVGLLAYPTRQLRTVNEFKKSMAGRMSKLKAYVRQLVKRLPVAQTNAYALNASSRYTYLIDFDFYQSIKKELEDFIYLQYMDGSRDYSYGNFWTDLYMRRAYIEGAQDAIQSAQNVTPAATAGDQLSSMIRMMSDDTLALETSRSTRIAMVGARMFERMKNFTEETRKELSDVLMNGVENGINSSKIADQMVERINVSPSRAMRIARTEVNQAYRTANRTEVADLNRRVYAGTDYELRMLWFSALADTTRELHGERHGLVYTVDEVTEFYATGANAINCYCSQTPVLYNKKTGETMQKDLIEKMAIQRESFKKAA